MRRSLIITAALFIFPSLLLADSLGSKWGIGINYIGLGIRHRIDSKNAVELRTNFENHIFAIGPRYYYNIGEKDKTVFFLGGEAGYLSFERDTSKKSGFMVAAFGGIKYFVTPNLGIGLDVGPAYIDPKGKDRAEDEGGVSLAANIGLTCYLSKDGGGLNIHAKEDVGADTCGSGICGPGEDEKNCCLDCGCKIGKCIDNKCVEMGIEISTDKELYRSKQVANITVNTNSSEEIKNATLKLYGIHARGKYYLNKTMNMDLAAGQNTENISYNLPSCTGCSGIKPGTYKIQCDIIYNNEVLATITKDIEIRQ